ncbi:TIGR02450 family Trp-rich protein [Paucibacter sp. APW11]|uniref:TIGR02450 family Trp-rich protein n=1 Tax=Roseateles aquae TaxID=3077235 RepID=A0ABU3PIL4_9BURK|nr:TIGR02450 family Trp-rich protein [Paucibacter sp. APW11]MDT9002387.1 TIGR02450 family Trp-rich protein [Paucibacter sp. APW11]
MNAVHPKKLLLSKWTAVRPEGREKHFLVSALVLPDAPGEALEWVEIEAVHSRCSQRIQWRELRDAERWRQGWV